MCIIFIYNGNHDPESDYSLIIASNRDEHYDRLAKNMAPWSDDPGVVGGLDLGAEVQSTWLAVSPQRKKIGVLLNLPGSKKDAKSRGRIVADYVKCDVSTEEYVESLKGYIKDCSNFVFVSAEFKISTQPIIQTYSNATEIFTKWTEPCLGFSNSLPDCPLKKVENGKSIFNVICNQSKKYDEKQQLIEALLNLLKSEERHLPDLQLEKRQPVAYKALSSIFVNMSIVRYGTRTHTIILVSKKGHMDLVEISLQPTEDLSQAKWERSEYNFC